MIYYRSATDLAEDLRQGRTTSLQLTESYLRRIEQLNPRIGAYLTVCGEWALAEARRSDERRRTGAPLSPWDGVPIALKDNLCTRGIKTTCASKILDNFVPPYTATVVEKCLAAGLIPLGKTNLDEFAMGSSTENSGFRTTANPWDTQCVPGGSSGGSAAAVGSGMAPLALGSDTGGSIRQPAALCGIVGLKPTYGLVSRYGLVAFASSLDQIGPMTRTVRDAATLLSIIAGHDPLDSTSATVETPDYAAALTGGIKGLRIGRPREFFEGNGLDPEVRSAVENALKRLEALGARIVDVSLPHSEYAVATYYLCATAEASSNLARYDGAHYGYRAPGTDNIIDMFSQTRARGFGREVQRRIMLGTYALSSGYYDAYYMKSLRVRTLIKRDFDKAFEVCDVIAGPTTPTPAFRFGEKTEDPLQMYLSDIYTISVNLAGISGISLNCGFSAGKLPIGLQLIAGNFQEPLLLRAANALEDSLELSNQHPEL